MTIKLADDLGLETGLPIKDVLRFRYSWKTDCHAVLYMEGYIHRGDITDLRYTYDSRLRLWMIREGEQQTLFFGVIVHIAIKMEGSLRYITLKAMSASCLLDRKLSSCSFQNVEKTYGEIVREAAESEGGRVIRDRKADRAIGTPVIRYEETVWQFARRLAGRSGTCILPDVTTGRPDFWFGMRKGRVVPAPPEEQYTVDITPIGKGKGIRYQTEGRIRYRLGDIVSYLDRPLTITEIKGCYERGEMVFQYGMEEQGSRRIGQLESPHRAGLGLWGIVREVKGEMLKIALDIDDGKETGDYLYPWQPETGNALYAMPEPGARVLLYFYDAEQKNGAVIHCMNKETQVSYKDRALDIADGNQLRLWKDEVRLDRGGGHSLSVGDECIAARTKLGVEISAGGYVFLRGRKIRMTTPEELVISQA